jgi:hypothetical protein
MVWTRKTIAWIVQTIVGVTQTLFSETEPIFYASETCFSITEKTVGEVMSSPTRSSLLTGPNHHQVGFGGISEFSAGYPG